MQPTRRDVLRAGLAVGLAGSVAGCGGSSDDTGSSPASTVAPPLEIGRIQFVAGRPTDYREYDPVGDKTYGLGEAVWVYFEPAGVARESAGSDAERFDLRIDGTVSDAAGNPQKTIERTVSRDFRAGRSLETLYLWVGADIPSDAPAGTWTVEFTLTDEISGQSTAVSREFEVEGGRQTDFPSTFRSALRSETAVQIDSLTMRDNRAVLAYASTHETDTSDWRREVGAVAGIYVRLVDQGWGAERLAVTTTGSGGRIRTWHVTRELARSFAAGEVGNQEFGQRILDTMEEQ